MQLISFSADSKRFEIGAEALDVLRKINTPGATALFQLPPPPGGLATTRGLLSIATVRLHARV